MSNPKYKTGQPDRRAYSILTDQHGREWGAITDNKSRHPIGPIDPLCNGRPGESGWACKPPLVPPLQYFRMDPRNASRITLRYEDWLRDVDMAMAGYERMRREAASKHFGTQASRALKDNPAELQDLVGPPPLTVPAELIRAMIAGNRWVLGLTATMPGWAEPIMEKWDEQRARAEQWNADYIDHIDYPDAEDEFLEPMRSESDEVLVVRDEAFAPGNLIMVSPGRWGWINENGLPGPMPDGEYFTGKAEEAREHLDELFKAAVP